MLKELKALALAPDKPQVPVVLPLLHKYRDDGHSEGGPLHIVVSDNNISDDCVRFCLSEAQDQNDEAGALLATILLKMSKTQRGKLAGQFYLNPPLTVVK